MQNYGASNGLASEEWMEVRTSWRGRGGAHQTAHVHTHQTSQPRMLSWQQMASFNVQELHDLDKREMIAW